MSASSDELEKAARESARASLERFADRDVHFAAGFVASWVVRNLTLPQLADLLEQMDGAFPEVAHLPGVVELPDESRGTAWERHDDPEADR